MNNRNVRECLGLFPFIPENELLLADMLALFVTTWFSSSRSTEQMMRGTANESPAFSALSKMSFVTALFGCSMLSKKGEEWLACSPDELALILLEAIGFKRETNDAESSTLASVEIKTNIAESSLDRNMQNATVDVMKCKVGEPSFLSLILKEHAAQLLHQMVVLSVNYVVYVAATESGVLFTAVVYCPQDILDTCHQALAGVAGTPVAWAHLPDPHPPEFADSATRNTLRLGLPFWHLVNAYVQERDPFPPVILFKHCSQSLYSKTKGGVDGSAQARAILRCSTSALKWEQKRLLQTLKTVAINSFIAWRMHKRREFLENKESFQSLRAFRHALNTTQSMADFIYDLCKELLVYAESVDVAPEGPDEEEEAIGETERQRLSELAKKRKKKRMLFFNSEDGKRLRLFVRDHTLKQQVTQQYCALCGMHRTSGDSQVWRGHRTTYKCVQCDVHLCVRIYPGLRKSCTELWHSGTVLKPRSTPKPVSHTFTAISEHLPAEKG